MRDTDHEGELVFHEPLEGGDWPVQVTVISCWGRGVSGFGDL